MGFLIRSSIEKHIRKIECINEYLLVIYLYFKKFSLMIINTYIPQVEKGTVKLITSTIQDRNKKYSRSFSIMVLGDFNHIVDPDMDRWPRAKVTKNFDFFHWLREMDN